MNDILDSIPILVNPEEKNESADIHNIIKHEIHSIYNSKILIFIVS